MTARFLLLACAVLITGCNVAGGGGVAFTGSEVQPGLASCLFAINRPDVAAEPDAPMSLTEIAALVNCTAERAGG